MEDELKQRKGRLNYAGPEHPLVGPYKSEEQCRSEALREIASMQRHKPTLWNNPTRSTDSTANMDFKCYYGPEHPLAGPYKSEEQCRHEALREIASLDRNKPSLWDNPELPISANPRACTSKPAQLVNKLAEWAPTECWTPEDVAPFTPSQCGLLHAWLVRLRRTPEFATDARRTQDTAAAMVRTACVDAPFRHTMLAQLQGNMEGCGDRTAMAFNELFTLWRVTTATELASDQRLQLCISLAKTAVLRRAVSRAVHGDESVEQYLWVETQLHDRLGLLSFARTCYNSSIGRRGMDVDAMALAVEAGWRRELFDMLDAQPNLFPDFPVTLPQQDARPFHDALDALQSCAVDKCSAAYLEQVVAVHREWRDCLLERQQMWLTAHT